MVMVAAGGGRGGGGLHGRGRVSPELHVRGTLARPCHTAAGRWALGGGGAFVGEEILTAS